MKTNVNFDAKIYIEFDDDSELWVSYCAMFNLVSQGRTKQEAIGAIQGAISMYLSECSKRKINFTAASKHDQLH